MKKIGLIVVFVIMAMALAVSAWATPKAVAVSVACDPSGNVTVGQFPTGAKLINIEVYDDVNGTPPSRIGPKSSFKLEPGQGFNFIFKDNEGQWYQLITPSSQAPGLVTDCSWIDPATGSPACKYLFPRK